MRGNHTSKVPNAKVMERLESILGRLETGDKLSVKALALEFGCSTKTIQRDINERLPMLCKHLSIEFKPMRSGKLIALPKQVVFSDFSDEIQVLQNNESHLFANISTENMTQQSGNIQTIELAISSWHCISFDYKTDKKSVDVLLTPLKIICFDGFWYLLGQDNKNSTIKKYYIKNISNLKVLHKAANKPKNINKKIKRAMNIWFDANAAEYEIRLYAQKEIAKYFMRMPISATQTIVAKDSDGGIELSVMITNDNEIIPTILKWIPNLFVLSPKTLKEKIDTAVTSFLEKSSQI
ncbi:MAG: WYL domain-containing protein [Campylobacterales bacterium]|nr:WYL domain-containing protein [Campylobacterales bacterium]